MNPYEEKASSIMKKHHPELRDWHGGNIVQVDECKDIVKAIHQAYNDGLAKSLIICDEQDPSAMSIDIERVKQAIRKELTTQKEIKK